VIGQAVLGFILPWILAMVAVPLETMISTGGHIVLSAITGVLHLGGVIARVCGRVISAAFDAAQHLYDIYIVIPLQIEKALARPPPESASKPPPRPEPTPSALGPTVMKEARR
jgi:hypothetical protein